MNAAPEDGRKVGATLEFWFEFASTYSYLSALRIREMAAEAGVGVIWRPFLLGPIFSSQGWNSSPFSIYPAKGRYMWRDVSRQAAVHDLPFVKPDVFPQNGLRAARLAMAALAFEPARGAAFCVEVFRAQFARSEDISQPEVVELARARAGLPDHLHADANAAPNQTALHTRTAQAQQAGIFGAPSFIAGNELFWGDDRLEQALAYASNAALTQAAGDSP